MEKKLETAIIESQNKISHDIYDLIIRTGLAKDVAPGQFIMIFPKKESTLLPRPISICEVDKEKDLMRIVYRRAGKGTLEFSTYQKGDEIKIMGNIGNGFPVEEGKGKKALLLAGGIGIPPMLELAKQIDGEVSVLLGFRDNKTFLEEEFKPYGTVYLSTEDGSLGTKGNVIDIIHEKNLEPEVMYACGPMPMLRAVKKYAQEKGIKAYLSLEERMACGVGACLGCVVKTGKKDHHTYVNNARVCMEGPVFEAGEVEIG